MLLFAHIGIALFIARFFRRADLAFVAAGSMLPDIIDKPLGTILFGSPGMGRLFAHTSLFLLLLIALAFYLQDVRIASLCGGVLVHLGLDFMWNSPATLLWPFLGPFPTSVNIDVIGYFEMLLLELKEPIILAPECFGLAYLIYLGIEMDSGGIGSKVRSFFDHLE